MMISRRPQPIIGKLTGNWGSGGNSGSAISPRSPLEIMNIQSTKGPKKYDFVCGVGLGIVAALGKSEHSHVSHRRDTDKPILHTRNQSRSNHVHLEMENIEEDYTFVTCHEPNKTNTRVYYNDGVGNCNGTVTRKNDTCFDTKSVKKHGSVMFDISASRFSDEVEDFPDNDFLEFCHLCRKTLHGKDIYMYRGEKAFCSPECRYVEMMKDEKKEKKKCTSDVVASR